MSSAAYLRNLLLFVFAATFALASACLNDSDTLAIEARARPDDITVLVGGFEREPKLYYQMRVDRITKEFQSNPNDLNAYDDIAVACDRLGNDDEAIRWIEEKHRRMPPYDWKSTDLWYRYYANCGTFWAHRWFAHGAKDSEMSQMKHARDLIQKAIDINPHAHFNREQAQLKVMDWAISRRTKDYVPLQYSFGSKDDIQGLLGLIRLGGAWRSVDVYVALSGVYMRKRKDPLAAFAYLRAKELLDAGQKSIDPNFNLKDYDTLREFQLPISFQTHQLIGLGDHDLSEYRRLRAEADAWDKAREDAMLVKLHAGDHPDTDPNFWNDIPPVPKLEYHPTMQERWDMFYKDRLSHGEMFFVIFGGAIFLAILIYIVSNVRASRRLKRAKATAS